MKLKDLNLRRKAGYRKDADNESTLERVNRLLQADEQKRYDRNAAIAHPFLFIYGLPRSGTTLFSQVLIRSFDLGYIDNVAARFWLAPLAGLEFSRNLLKGMAPGQIRSEYGSTAHLADIHEFGYFWRYWLQKDDLDGIVHAERLEEEIDWEGLRVTLANIQRSFQKPMVFKNLFGAYHAQRLHKELGKTLFLHIERDKLDNTISILDARRKFYDDPKLWWSTAPPEIKDLLHLDYRKQIAGQVYYLDRYYQRLSAKMEAAFGNVLKVSYRDLTENTQEVLERIAFKYGQLEGSELTIRHVPEGLRYRTYSDREEEKTRFRELLGAFE